MWIVHGGNSLTRSGWITLEDGASHDPQWKEVVQVSPQCSISMPEASVQRKIVLSVTICYLNSVKTSARTGLWLLARDVPAPEFNQWKPHHCQCGPLPSENVRGFANTLVQSSPFFSCSCFYLVARGLKRCVMWLCLWQLEIGMFQETWTIHPDR